MKLFIRPDVAVSTAFLGVSPASREKLAVAAMYHAMSAVPPSPERVIANFCQGMLLLGKDGTNALEWEIFPQRAVITPETAHIPKRVKGYMRQSTLDIERNLDFDGVLRACQRRDSTWINEPLMEIYERLFAMGAAESIEAYQEGELVGGIWGIRVGRTFSVMSMFHTEDRAGTITFGTLVKEVMDGEIGMVDCGLMAPHFSRFGAEAVPREVFMERVARGLA
jgi:leucyl/phenylalanyl-tRNA--protein transferase